MSKTTLQSLFSFVRREPVLLAAAIAASISCFWIPPDKKYLSYFDFRTLAMLYCLMAVVAGLRKAGLFTHLAHSLCRKAGSIRTTGLLLVLLCFFSSMLITNDVALLTFVPFSIVVLELTHSEAELIHIVVLQTVAANLGSMLTPVGNPQNLYLYSHYNLGFAAFLRLMLPPWLLSLLLVSGACFLLSGSHLYSNLQKETRVDIRSVILYLSLFAVCLLVVFRLLPWQIMLGIIAFCLLIFDKNLLLKPDLMLLLTFAAFFVFSGNLARIPAVDHFLRSLITGREYLVSMLTSQVISNVPAALLISGFTDQSEAVLLGVNIGGLGTLVASLASLISIKLYTRSENARLGRYFLEFTIVNGILITVLSLSLMFI